MNPEAKLIQTKMDEYKLILERITYNMGRLSITEDLFFAMGMAAVLANTIEIVDESLGRLIESRLE